MTEEQSLIVGTNLKQGELMKVDSYAGSSKSFVLREYAKARPEETFLYIAYNTTVAAEGRESFPVNTTCRTSHSIAFGKEGYKYKHKLGFLKPYILKDFLAVKNFAVGKFILDVLNKYLCSADRYITEEQATACVDAITLKRADDS